MKYKSVYQMMVEKYASDNKPSPVLRKKEEYRIGVIAENEFVLNQQMKELAIQLSKYPGVISKSHNMRRLSVEQEHGNTKVVFVGYTENDHIEGESFKEVYVSRFVSLYFAHTKIFPCIRNATLEFPITFFNI